MRSRTREMAVECDALWRDIVLRPGKCALCGQPGRDPHHIFGRGRTVRWLLENGVCLCRGCHRMVTDSICPEQWRVILASENYERLRAAKDAPGKVDMEAVKENLTGELERLQREI